MKQIYKVKWMTSTMIRKQRKFNSIFNAIKYVFKLKENLSDLYCVIITESVPYSRVIYEYINNSK